MGLLVLRQSSMCKHAIACTPAGSFGICRSWLGLFQPVAPFPNDCGLPQVSGGSAPRTTFRGLYSVHMTLRPAYSPRASTACFLEGFDGFVSHTAAPIATGWRDLCRVGIAPTEELHLFTTHRHPCSPRTSWFEPAQRGRSGSWAFNFSRQVITHTRQSSRFGRALIVSRLQ